MTMRATIHMHRSKKSAGMSTEGKSGLQLHDRQRMKNEMPVASRAPRLSLSSERLSRRLPGAVLVEETTATVTAFSPAAGFHERNHRRYPVPRDLWVANALYQANCGPASFAAVLGTYITQIMQFFTHFPLQPHTNIPQMRGALRDAGVLYDDAGDSWPTDGLCLIQIDGPWNRSPWAACRFRHWVGTRNGFIYDVNENAWLSLAEWQRRIMEPMVTEIPKAEGWTLLRSFAVEPQPTSFPECPVSATA